MPVENTPSATDNNAASAQAGAPEPQSTQDLFSQSLASTQAEAASQNNAGASTPPPAQSQGAAAPAQQQSSPQAASAAAAQANFRELAAKAGLPVTGYNSDVELFNAMLAERKQLMPMAQLGQQAAPHFTDFQRYLQSQQGQPAQQPQQAAAADPNAFDPDKHFDKEWGVPAWDPAWNSFLKNGWVKENDAGQMVAAPGYEFAVSQHLAAINAHLDGRQENAAKLFQENPFKRFDEVITPVWERRMEAMIEKRFGAQATQQQQQTAMSQFDSQFRSQLFDASGAPTQIGQRVGEIAGRMMGDPQNPRMPEHEALMLAAEALGLQPGQASAAAQAPVPAAAQPAVPASPQQQSGAQVASFIDQARTNAMASNNSAPYAPTTTNPSNDPTFGEVGLADLFRQAAQPLLAGGH